MRTARETTALLTLTAAVVLSLAAAGGAALALLRVRRARVPFAAGLGHAGLALGGIGLLTLGVWRAPQPAAVNAALLCAAMALVGGLFVLLFRLQGEPPPGFMVVLHALAAVVALTLLWVGLG